jgi:dipeptidyl aminopeptidase/acylaminoacyl peptidase
MRLQAKSVLLLTWLLLVGCAAVQPDTLTDRGGWVVQRTFLPHRQNASKKIEVLWTKPEAPGPWPAVLFIHGHQEQPTEGGAAFVRTGRLGTMASRGYVAAAVSQPGYGHSDGPPDFCGPFTQEAVLVVVDFLRHQPFVQPQQVVLYGYSRGAQVASMVTAKDPQLAAVVLGAGAYDFFRWYPTPLRGIDANIEREAGTTAAAFSARSAIYHADKIKAPILLLHGAQDERVPVHQAEAFAEKLQEHGVAVTLKIFPHAMHGIPVDEQYHEIYPFLDQALRRAGNPTQR